MNRNSGLRRVPTDVVQTGHVYVATTLDVNTPPKEVLQMTYERRRRAAVLLAKPSAGDSATDELVVAADEVEVLRMKVDPGTYMNV